jgi:uncharacterized 2Fe-2S/4Fe-4S cluster protein (DUF4445 family)
MSKNLNPPLPGAEAMAKDAMMAEMRKAVRQEQIRRAGEIVIAVLRNVTNTFEDGMQVCLNILVGSFIGSGKPLADLTFIVKKTYLEVAARKLDFEKKAARAQAKASEPEVKAMEEKTAELTGVSVEELPSVEPSALVGPDGRPASAEAPKLEVVR